MDFLSNSVEESIQWAKQFAQNNIKAGDIILLEGDLGAGKTHIVKGIISAFQFDMELVHSPTFTLINEYHTESIDIYHFDCYRLKSIHEAFEIGVEDYLYGDGICLIEWPSKIEEILPSDCLTINVEHLGPSKRKIVTQIP